MSDDIEGAFSKMAEEKGLKEVWVPLIDGRTLLALSEGDLQGVEVFLTIEDMNGPVAEALARRNKLPVPLTPLQLEEFLDSLDPEAVAYHFIALCFDNKAIVTPRSRKGVEYLQAVEAIEECRSFAEEADGGLLPVLKNALDRERYSC